MKFAASILLSVLSFSVSAENAQPTIDQLIGEWVFDVHRYAIQRLRSQGLDVDAHMPEVEQTFSDEKLQASLPRLTITDSHLIFHENDHNPRREQPYKIIGGNSALAIVEHLDEDNIETIVHIHIYAEGISFANPGCETYAEQCERQKARYMNRLMPRNDTMTSSSPIDEDQLERSWQEQVNSRVFFTPATDLRSTH